jgi:uncharacterized damage-inducible protein DinB
MTDHVLESARKLAGDSLSQLNASIEGLPVEALNWRPTVASNSVAVIVTHTVGATRLWLRMAMGLPLPERDRDAEFRAEPTDANEFRGFVREMSADCAEALQSADAVDWSASRQTQGRGGDAPPEVAAAYALIHATEHLRGHVDQVSLMRQLWEART